MTIRNLDAVFQPKSIAVIGPSRLPQAAIDKLVEMLAATGPTSKVTLVGVSSEAAAIATVPGLEALAAMPDLAVVLTGPEGAPELVDRLGNGGTRAVIFVSIGYDEWPKATMQATLDASRRHMIRIIGPGSLGVIAPHGGIGAAIASRHPRKGDLALVSRSAAVINATLAWAAEHHVGFSSVVSLGQKADVDIGDLLDWYAGDYRTRAALMHFESISTPAKFMSAARACARVKPVIVIRSGVSRDRVGVGYTHSGRLASPDAVYDAAFQRSGLLRVESIDELFDAAETISKVKTTNCRHLAILSNGRSLATMAADHLRVLGGSSAVLSPATREKLEPFVRPGSASETGNPVTLEDDATPETYATVLGILLEDPGVDAVAAIHAPTAFVTSDSIAGVIADLARKHQKKVGRKRAILAAVLDERSDPRGVLEEAGVPCHSTPEAAVTAFMYVVRYVEAQERLTATPANLPAEATPNVELARSIVRDTLAKGRNWLSPKAVRDILEAYQVPVASMLFAADGAEAEMQARKLFASSERLVVKIAAADMPFKSDKGGVRLDLATPRQVAEAADEMLARFRVDYPDAEIEGVIIMPMIERKGAVELICGLADDPVFGPVVVFGRGGRAVEVIGDCTLDLVPLDMNLAQAMIQRTRVAKLLAGYRSSPPADLNAIALTLVKLSQLAADVPEVRELDLNPIIADETGVIALDARVRVVETPAVAGKLSHPRLVIRPYPKDWERMVEMRDGSEMFVRPIKPEDEPAYAEFFKHITPNDLRLRFFAPIKDFSHSFLAKLTQLDYARAMALGAFKPDTGELMGVVRLHADPDHKTGEYAVMVRSGLKGVGLGWALMELIIEWARADGIEVVKGEVLRENTTMLKVCEGLGFKIKTSPDDEAVMLVTFPVKDMPVSPKVAAAE